MERKNDMATDEELYGQYLCGDETGLELLIKKYGDPLTLYIDGYLHDVHEAEDLMMETFSWLFTKKPRIRDGCFKAYLYKAARHMALRHKSRRRIFFSLDDLAREPEAQTLVEEIVRTKERNQILHLCMDELNPDYREALYLTYFEGMSYQQAAKVMGKSVKQITNMVYRGKERLRGLLKREHRIGIYGDRTAGFYPRRVRDYSVFSHPSAEQRGADGETKGGQWGWS